MLTDQNVNHALLRGTAAGEAEFSHENHGVKYYTFPLSVLRLSGSTDTVNVIAARETIAGCGVKQGVRLEAEGEVRSFNNKSGQGSRLMIFLYAKSLRSAQEEEDMNTLELVGTLCKPTTLRYTPLGREICDLMIAVNRRYGRSDYLPCIAWGALARKCGTLAVGETLHMDARFQSRKYTKVMDGVSTERTAYEISVMHLEVEAREARA